MDQALQARLIGAVIVVGLGVLVIPELLSGRKSDPPVPPASAAAGSSPASRTITIELGTPPQGSAGSVAKTPATVPAKPDNEPLAPLPASSVDKTGGALAAQAAGSAIERGSPGAGATTQAGAERAPGAPGSSSSAEAPTVLAAAKPVAASAREPASESGRTWSVQVGAFGSANAAEKLETELDGAGYTAYLAPTRQGSKALHRVRVGPVTERAEADRLAARLKARGLPVAVVAND